MLVGPVPTAFGSVRFCLVQASADGDEADANCFSECAACCRSEQRCAFTGALPTTAIVSSARRTETPTASAPLVRAPTATDTSQAVVIGVVVASAVCCLCVSIALAFYIRRTRREAEALQIPTMSAFWPDIKRRFTLSSHSAPRTTTERSASGRKRTLSGGTGARRPSDARYHSLPEPPQFPAVAETLPPE